MHTSWSEIDTIRHCLHKHHLAYKLDLTPKETARPLSIGLMWHTLMELTYTEGPDQAVAQLRFWQETENEHWELLAWVFDGYYKRWWFHDRDREWGKVDPEMVELEFLVDLPDVGFGPLKLKGFIDLVVTVGGRLWVADHKSGAYKPRMGELEMADQWSLYVYALRQMGYEVFGSIHSYAMSKQLVRTQTLEERFQRTLLMRSDNEVERAVREATVHAWLGKGENGAPRSPGEWCWRRCDFEDVCIANRKYGDAVAGRIVDDQFTLRDRSG